MPIKSMKILIADDDRDQLELRSLLLVENGFQTIQALDAVSALKAAKLENPACAIVDLRLPTEDAGIGLIRALKDWNAGISVIVLTGANPRHLEGLPERTLVDAVIVKGSPFIALLQELRSLG
jgi:CheY-like chemotaxis protein